MTELQEKMVYNFSIFADNFQFHLQDQIEDCEYPEDWNDSLLTRLFAEGHHVVGIGTVRDLDCDVTLEVYYAEMDEKKQQEDPDMSESDHVVQCNLDVPSGKLMFTGCLTDPEDTVKFEIPPGHYGVRIFWSGLDHTDELGFEGEDRYTIQLWPNTNFDEIILKYWRNLINQIDLQNN